MKNNLKKLQTILITLVILITIFTSETLADNIDHTIYDKEPEYYEKAYRYETQGWIYIHIEGQPYERGYQYGYLASEEIIDIIHRWIQWGYKNRNKNIINMKNEKNIWNLYKKHAKDLFLNKIPEEYINEIKGVTDGIKSKGVKLFDKEIEFEDILTLQLVQDVLYSCFKYRLKSFHPLRGAIAGIKNFISKIIGNSKNEHCIAFIATGNATKNGEIIVAHSTLFDPIIAEKCNIILDVQPSQGYRFTMTTYPGAIWSCEDYYQNEKGIILTETELPQGPWEKNGIPKGVRSRKAIQYSDSINDVINYLMEGNNGLIPNEWLIGDTKTGEIASLEQALFNTPIKRTFNGFYWSCNYPHNKHVKRELYGISSIFIDILVKTMPSIPYFAKINKFRELEKEAYGKIDIETAKKILSTEPLSQGLTDGKITTSHLLKNMNLIVHMGNPKSSASSTLEKTKDNSDEEGDNQYPHGWVVITLTGEIPEYSGTQDTTQSNNYPTQVNKDPQENSILSYILTLIVLVSIIFFIFNIYKRRNKK